MSRVWENNYELRVTSYELSTTNHQQPTTKCFVLSIFYNFDLRVRMKIRSCSKENH